jgi:hypothetical protein|tara:strand:- start:3264 stop:3599 length:336 start_codon:yes stop_codon:yes gene_type:complete
VDTNRSAIIEALRDAGAVVYGVSGVAVGCPDLLVGLAGQTFLVEVKDGAKPPSARRLTKDQRTFMSGWTGGAVVVLRDVTTARTWARRRDGLTGQTLVDVFAHEAAKKEGS